MRLWRIVIPRHVFFAGVLAGLTLAACRRSPGPVELRVASDGEFIAFEPTELSCVSGDRVRVSFHHAGQRIPQKHNWVLVRPGSELAVEKAGTAAGEAQNWLAPGDSRVLAATPLCSPGGDAVVQFTAPAPGDYPFICSTPGHAAEMHGILHVLAR